MIKTPLHHCYLVSAYETSDCIDTLKKQLKSLSTTPEDILFDIDIAETLTIDIARELRNRGRYKAGDKAYYIIRGFDAITIEAQNALLKIIEDPASNIHFFLVTPEPDRLLETVRSRSHILDNVCLQESDADIEQIIDEFLTASGLARRLEVVSQLKSKRSLQLFVKGLAKTDLSKDNPSFGVAVEQVADWSRDIGASVKLLGQYLAITASDSLKDK